MNEAQLLDRIRKRYPSPAWAVLQHVRNQTGFGKRRVRTADAIALSLWPSNGLAMHGFEVKVSASDLKKELLDPTKSAEFSEYCNYWWIVVSSESLIKSVEIPQKWGVLAANGSSLKVVSKAPLLEPKPLDLGLVCGMIRNAASSTETILKGMVPQADVQKAIKEGVESEIKSHAQSMQRQYDNLRAAVDEFEKSSGLFIRDRFWGDEMRKAVAFVKKHGVERVVEMARHEHERALRYSAELDTFIKSMEVDQCPQSQS